MCPQILVRRVAAERRCASTSAASAASNGTSSWRTATAPSSAASCRSASAAVRAATSSSAPSCALQGCKASRLSLLVLLAAKGITGRFEAIAEELAGRVKNLMQIFAGPKEVLERDRSLWG